jgi:hypothetical protein
VVGGEEQNAKGKRVIDGSFQDKKSAGLSAGALSVIGAG